MNNVKEVTVSLIKLPGMKRPEVQCKVSQTESDTVQVTPEMYADGSRYIVMNNADQIVVARYNCIVAEKAHREYGLDLEKVLFEEMRKQLGFKRQF